MKLARMFVLLTAASLALAACSVDKSASKQGDIDETILSEDGTQNNQNDADEALLNDEPDGYPLEKKDGYAYGDLDDDSNEVVDIVALLTRPSVGTMVNGLVYVDEVISDRGFYVTDGDQRVFVTMREQTEFKDAMININAGQALVLEGVLADEGVLKTFRKPIDEDTKEAVEENDYFIVTTYKQVTIVDERATPPAQ
jgi:hypothetical protein